MKCYAQNEQVNICMLTAFVHYAAAVKVSEGSHDDNGADLC